MAATTLTLYCLINGENSLEPFLIEISSDKTVAVLKEAIISKGLKVLKNNEVEARHLVLWRAVIPIDASKSTGEKCTLTLGDMDNKTKLDSPRTILSKLFPEGLDDNIYIIVEVPKGSREEDIPPPPKKARLDVLKYTLRAATEEAGLTEKALEDDDISLSRLDDKERVSVLRFLGSSAGGDNSFSSLRKTARAMQNSPFQDTEILSTSQSSASPTKRRIFPVVRTRDLYVRQAYRDLYTEIIPKFQNSA